MNLHVFTSRAREEADFQGIRFLTGAARIVLMAVIYLNCSNRWGNLFKLKTHRIAPVFFVSNRKPNTIPEFRGNFRG